MKKLILLLPMIMVALLGEAKDLKTLLMGMSKSNRKTQYGSSDLMKFLNEINT